MKLLLCLAVPQLIIAGNYSPYGNLCPKVSLTSSSDAINNLSSFTSLYVKFGNCAYSIQTNGNQGGGGGDNEGWYMGYQFARGANVAYSLFGSKSGVGGCSKSTFINSFYTLDGLSTFVQSVGLSLSDVYTYGYSQQDGGGGGGGGNNGGCTSALICGENNKKSNTFIQASFTDGMCHLSGYSETSDLLTSLNSALEKQSCVKISEETALTLLTYSQTCTALSGGQCPDPFGILADCEAKYVEFDQFILKEGQDDSKPYRWALGSFLYLISLGLVFYTFSLMRKKQQGVDDDSYPSDSYQSTSHESSHLSAAYAPSRTLSIQSVAHSVAQSVKEMAQAVKDVVSADDDGREPLGTMSSDSSKPKKKGPFALLRRGRNRK